MINRPRPGRSGQTPGPWVLRVLEVRGVPVTEDVRERIASCTDLTLVSAWLDRAGTVERAEDLFSDRAVETSGEH
ncbi:hypothetical protein F3K32_20440 [Streptomyces sp. LBUM 1483]|nr:hypothetical protein [Streptomyces sp. LBUM 1483]MBP5922602.1 hypothetical protein [Streptomyces sp. LBUM 1483]